MVLLYHIAYQNASRSIAAVLYIDDLDNVFIEWVSNNTVLRDKRMGCTERGLMLHRYL